MKLPSGWGVGAIEMRLYDEGCDSLSLCVDTVDRHGRPFVVMSTTETGVALSAEDLYRLGDLASELIGMYETLNSEAPDAGDEPAAGITPTAEQEPIA